MNQPVHPRPVVIEQRGEVNILIRAVYFIFFGLWASGVWAAIAWFLCVTVIGLPIGLWMLNKLPQVSTLQARSERISVLRDGRIVRSDMPQLPFLIRALYFVLIGWWFSALWITAAWALTASVIGLILGFWMLNRVPAVITLAR